jgi:hypothetical protein
MEIKNTRVYNMERAVMRSRIPMKYGEPENIVTGKDYLRAEKLSKCKTGTGHDTFLKGIIVNFDIKYSQYFSMQFQRYKFIDIVSSQSKMHTITKQRLNYKNCNKYVSKYIMDAVNIYIKQYNSDKTYENFMRVVSNIPMGFELWMNITTNYLQLKTVYQQRRHHKLKEDWGYFCDWIETLSYHYFITGK